MASEDYMWTLAIGLEGCSGASSKPSHPWSCCNTRQSGRGANGTSHMILLLNIDPKIAHAMARGGGASGGHRGCACCMRTSKTLGARENTKWVWMRFMRTAAVH